MKKSHQISVGQLKIGGAAPVVVQSMTNTDTRDPEKTIAQIERLTQAGCELVRVAVPDRQACDCLPRILEFARVPVIADIHFDYRLAIGSLERGAHGIRINPGNIGSREKIDRVIDCAKLHGAAIRVGVNSGSLEKRVLQKYGHPSGEALAESALDHVRHMESRGFENIKISLKSSSVLQTIRAYRKIAELCDYPLHIGVTEAGSLLRGAIKSAIGLGILLHEGIGDTLRVSLTADPVEEVRVAYEILRALGLRHRGPEIISCPTCGRTEINLFQLVEEVERRLADTSANLTVAVMGCMVNGPGEAREADIGIAGGRDRGVIFRKGKIVRSADGQDNLLKAFMEELDILTGKTA